MYSPKDIDRKAAIPDEILKILEDLAEGVHDTWAAGRISEGWTYGEKEDPINKTTPNLVPYAQLPEQEKEYDRNTALTTLRIIYAQGYSIVKAK